MDPGKTYYTYAIGIMNTLHRGLFAYPPGDSRADAGPRRGRRRDLRGRQDGHGQAQGGRDVLRAGEARGDLRDVKYAIERAFTGNVANGYARRYFGDLSAPPKEPGDYKEIPGIETPDDQTIVFKLSKGTGAALAGALAMPISIPVPEGVRGKYDKENPSKYGEQYAVFTGPYKVETDAQGKPTGYVAGKRIKHRPQPRLRGGGRLPPGVPGRDRHPGRQRGHVRGDPPHPVRREPGAGEIEPPANQLKRLLESNKTELSAVPGGGWRMISMDTSRPPFDDLNVRKAVIAGFDRNAVRQQRGGEALGPIAQGLIPPGLPGFEESGGFEGFSRSSTGSRSPRATEPMASTSRRPASTTGSTRATRNS